MYKQFISLLNQPIVKSKFKKEIYFSIFIGLSVFIILLVFQPFGTNNFNDDNKVFILFGYGIIISLGYIIFAFIFPLIFKRFYHNNNNNNWTIGNELLHYVFVFFLIIVLTYFYRNIIFNVTFSFERLFRYTLVALSTGIIPLSFVLLLKYYPFFIERPKQINTTINSKNTLIHILGGNKKEELSFNIEELLFIKSLENYVEIYLFNKQKIQKNILRSTLTKIKSQIHCESVIQVHRSYIVNLKNTTEIIGKSPNYKLKLYHSDFEIPISRTKIKFIREKVQQEK